MNKQELLNNREIFFKQISEHILKEPTKIDHILNQDKYYIKPNLEDIIINVEYGDMVIKINGKFYDKEFNIFYSLWQLSDTLKIGIALSDDDLQGAFSSDTHNEAYYIWGWKNDPKVDIARGCVFYDWEFDVPHLYDNYKEQERFILGIRHMHFRTMRIIHDECERLFFESKSKEEEFIEDLNMEFLLKQQR